MTHPHTTDLEHSKELADACKKMGVEMPESYFMWINPFKEQGWEVTESYRFGKNNHHEYAPAIQLGELMRMLPHEILFKSNKYYLSIRYYIGLKVWVLKYLTDSGSYKLAEGKNEVPENAACDLLTELILQGKVKTLSV